MLEIKNILFPCDLSKNSAKILPHVLLAAEKHDSSLFLLHVVEDLAKWGTLHVPHPTLDRFKREALEGAEKALDDLCETHMQSCPNFKRLIVSGDPVTEILKAVDEHQIDLVIMGTHGRKGLEHTLFGSVAENVIKKASVPVMVVNPYSVK